MPSKISDLRTQSSDQLKKTLMDLRKESFNIRFQRASGEFENTSRIRVIRRTIARIKTLITSINKKNKLQKA